MNGLHDLLIMQNFYDHFPLNRTCKGKEDGLTNFNDFAAISCCTVKRLINAIICTSASATNQHNHLVLLVIHWLLSRLHMISW